MDATAKLAAIVALAAFATERILAAVNYLMNAERLRRVQHRAAGKLRARERRKLVLMTLAGIIAVAVVDRADLGILRVLQVGNVHPLVDFWLTWLVVFAGADRVRGMMNGTQANQNGTPVVRVQVNGGEIRSLQRVS